MAFDEPGLSFLPREGAPGGSTSPFGGKRLEDIIRILSLRIPQVVGAPPSVAPQAVAGTDMQPGRSAVNAIVSNAMQGPGQTMQPSTGPLMQTAPPAPIPIMPQPEMRPSTAPMLPQVPPSAGGSPIPAPFALSGAMRNPLLSHLMGQLRG
jgi:hypothetical protein